MQARELWSPEDQESLAVFEVAVHSGDLAGALLALEGAPVVMETACRSRLQDLGSLVKAEAAHDDPAHALVRVLVQREGFRGDTAEDMEPQDSHLGMVLARRRGQPIVLSALWILAGEQAGIPVEGIGLPGHFIVRVGGVGGVLADPFGGGSLLSVADCAAIVHKASKGSLGWQPSFLTPASVAEIAERVVRNLLGAYQHTGETEMIYRTSHFLVALRPNDPDVQFLRARLADELGARVTARELYTSVEEHFPGTEAADAAGARLHEMRAEHVELN